MPTGDADFDERQRQRQAKPLDNPIYWQLLTISTRLEAELQRLEKNRERRHQREKYRKRTTIDAGSPSGAAMSPDGEAPAGGKEVKATQRKCANCGQVGHIKTNKKCVHCKLPFDEKCTSSLAVALDIV